jgi:LPXTG-site transpeptidase (sortase) family protein
MFAGAFAAIAGVSVLAIAGFRALQPGEETTTHSLVLSGYDDPGGIYDRPLNFAATPTPPPTPAPVVAVPAAPPLRDIPYRLIIDKIGVNAPVGTYGLGSDQIPDVPSNGQEVAWYDFSAHPGGGSNAVFAGHVTWNGRGVFYHLDDLASGDQVTLVANNGGAKLTYTVSEVFLVDADDPNSVSVMSPTPGKDQVTIITCGGDPFYVGGVAEYDYTHRLIVRASLTGVFAADAAPAGGG